MAEQTEDQAETAPRLGSRRRLGCWIFGILALIVAAAAAFVWFSREELADDLIASQLEDMGLEASYTIDRIGPRRQIVSQIVIGDPEHPDLTIERAEIRLVPRFPFVGIGRVILEKPRLYGSYRDGKLSFGSLDPLLYEQPSTEPFMFPDMELVLDDARALIETDYGPVGAKAQGNGHLRGGFAGILAVNAPQLSFEGCDAQNATLFGEVSIDAERPGFSGPLRLASLDCPEQGVSLRDAGLNLQVRVDRNLAGFEGDAGLAGGALAIEGNRVEAVSGSSQFAWRKEALTASYELAVQGVDTPDLALGRLSVEGSARSSEGFEKLEIETDIDGAGLRPGPALFAALGDAADATSGTLLGPMLAQIRSALAREGRGSSLAANVTMRKTGQVLSAVVPQASLRGSSGSTLLSISRFQFSSSGDAPRFSGSFTTGGRGLPQISGRMENRGGSSDAVLRLRMAEYSAQGGSLSVPELQIERSAAGTIGFRGSAVASGAIPGGKAQALRLPIAGDWSADRGLSAWRECTDVSFASLTLASLTLEKRELELCPPSGGAILRSDDAGTRIAAGTPGLDLAGHLGETQIALRSGAVGLAWPGNMTVRDVDITLGPPDSATRFKLSELDAKIDSGLTGEFSGADMRLFAVPLDILDATGNWQYADGRLELTGGSLRVEDREAVDRFEPLIARDATLTLEDNRITADALLREPESERAVTQAHIVHDLGTGTGFADLDVDELVFDEDMQPDTLTKLALGVVANANGTVRGAGRIDWNADEVTSTGRFTTDNFDFAAAFGPVEGVSGTIEFTDLLGLVTAPRQRLRIHSFNPGIEVDEGELVYELDADYLMVIHGGRWPFIGGMLVLEPTQTRLAEAETRRYTLRLEAVDAGEFVQRMDLSNIAATGLFDGTVPLVFDENGGRIEQGHLQSRPPGGNLSYVGELTYEDLSTMANFAFDALRSLDYREMEIFLDGSLTGEIVTRVRFDGIRQGESAKRNFVTKQLANLPIRFNVNIHAPFYKLITAIHSMYDPALVRDPREIGLLDSQGRRTINPTLSLPPEVEPEELPLDEAPIQPPESGALP